jgi:hypothetical protein
MSDTPTPATDPTLQLLRDLGYFFPRRLPDGSYAAIAPLLYTTGLVVPIDPDSGLYARRYCYEHTVDAIGALRDLQGADDEPTPGWIARRIPSE